MASNSQFHSAAVAISNTNVGAVPNRDGNHATYNDDDDDEDRDNDHVFSEPSVASRNTAQALCSHKSKGELNTLLLALGCR